MEAGMKIVTVYVPNGMESLDALSLHEDVAQHLGYQNGAVLTRQQADEAIYINAACGLEACREAREAAQKEKETDQSGQWSAQTMLEFVMAHLPDAQFAEFVRLTNEVNEALWHDAEAHTGGWNTGGLI